MKTKWHECVSWCVLSLSLLCCAADTNETPITRRKGLFLKLAASQSKLPTTDSSPAGGAQLRSSLTPVTPRSMRPAQAGKPQSDFAVPPDVSVTCSTSDFVLWVEPGFFGLGADIEELTLGSGCKSNGVLRPYGDILFMYPLTACDAVRETFYGYLVYKYVLHYEPSAKRSPSRSQRIDVTIECRYQRNHHVYRLAVKPTWKTAVIRKKLKGRQSDFSVELMDDSWSAPATKRVYRLGQTVNIQVSAPHLPLGGKLYISSCYAAPSSGSESSLKYIIIENFGCMVDSRKVPGASQFIHQTDKTLQFSLKAFQFTTDPDTEVNIHCNVSVTSEDPSPAHKSCTYRRNRWEALTGDHSICECCDSKCMIPEYGGATMEGFASSDMLLVSDQPHAAEDDFSPVGSSVVSMITEDETTASPHTDEPNNQKYLWKNTDVLKNDGDEETDDDYVEEELDDDETDSSVIRRLTSGLDIESSVFRHGVLVEERNEAEDGGSGYDTEEDFLEGEEEEERSMGEEGKISAHHWNQREGGVSHHWMQKEKKPLEFEEKRNYPNRGEGHERTRAYDVEQDDSLADGVDEMTWYFTWR